MTQRILTLISDFRSKDPFVGIMKGVILGINPNARLVDLCHEIDQGDTLRASYILDASLPYFPRDTIHVVVVDPGVGSSRKKILVKSAGAYFIAPDNGVLSVPLKRHGWDMAVEIINPEFFLHPASATFHGRDVFAPVAAHLSLGTDIRSFGGETEGLVLWDIPAPVAVRGRDIRGEIIYKDTFGNMTTNLRLARGENPLQCQLRIRGGKKIPLVTHYSAVREKELSSIINSSGLVEIFVRNGDAAQEFGLRLGEGVDLEQKTP